MSGGRTKVILLAALCAGTVFAQGTGGPVAQWTRFEAEFTSAKDYENAVQDVRVTVEFTSPSGMRRGAEAFWDGERLWKVRFSPEEVGNWRYRTTASDADNGGLHGREGSFACTPYRGGNPLYGRGALRVSADRRHLQHADGTPFFWLSDTNWAGALLSEERSWRMYLADRFNKGFTAVQFMGAQNIAAAGDAQGRQAFAGKEKIIIDPYFFRRLDHRVDAINEAGLIASPTFSWAAEWHPSAKLLDPGAWLDDEQLIVLCRYFTSRYGAHQVVWMFAGDHDYRGEKAERWRKVGRAVFGANHHRLVTVHPAPRMLLKTEFGPEPWLSFLGYQSSHSSADATVRWIVQGEPAREWDVEPIRPVINIEPIYEAHMNFGRERLATALDVRQPTWWSLLVSPTAGVSYGAHGVWSWETQPAIPMNHYRTGVARPWNEAMNLPGSTHMKHIADFFGKLEWWKLRPAPDLLAAQPGEANVQHWVAAARATDGSFAVVYVPASMPVALKKEALGGMQAQWFDPASGRYSKAAPAAAGPEWRLAAQPENGGGDGDWVLLLKRQ